MDIIIDFLISLVTSLFVVFIYSFARRYFSHRNKLSRITAIEMQLSDLKKKLTNLEDSINSAHSQPCSVSPVYSDREQQAKVEKHGKSNRQRKSKLDARQNVQEKVQQDEKPNDLAYTFLFISNGKLAEAVAGQASYYRAWRQNGKLFFEFYCDPQRMEKAINNRLAIIDPCCNKDNQSIDPNMATSIVSVRYGELDNNFNILSKAIIKFS